jgi:hypothetical protein
MPQVQHSHYEIVTAWVCSLLSFENGYQGNRGLGWTVSQTHQNTALPTEVRQSCGTEEDSTNIKLMLMEIKKL